LDELIIGAWGVDLVDKIAVGKSYVVFGKIDNTAINLSAISSGTGGFLSFLFSPIMTKPPVPIADRSIAVLSALPKTT
jgi:hypothetical protein